MLHPWIPANKLDPTELKTSPCFMYKDEDEYEDEEPWSHPNGDINWSKIYSSRNPEAFEWLSNQTKGDSSHSSIIWNRFSANASDHIMAWLTANPDKIDWHYLSANSHDQSLTWLEANPDKIDWPMLSSYNRNDRAIALLASHIQAHPDCLYVSSGK